MPIIPVFGRERQEDQSSRLFSANNEFEVILGCRRPYFKTDASMGGEKGRAEDLEDVGEGHRIGAFHPCCRWNLMC